MSYVARWKM